MVRDAASTDLAECGGGQGGAPWAEVEGEAQSERGEVGTGGIGEEGAGGEGRRHGHGHERATGTGRSLWMRLVQGMSRDGTESGGWARPPGPAENGCVVDSWRSGGW